MSYEKEIVINVKTKEAAKDMRDFSAIIIEQKEITIEFEEELQRLEKQLKDTSKGNLAGQKAIKDQIVNIKDALKDQSLSMKQLTLEKQKAASADKGSIVNLQKTSTLFQVLNRATGGMAKAFLDLGKASKLSGAAMKTALISSGIGIAVVAVGLLYENFDKVKSVLMKLIPGLETVGKFLGKIINAVTDFIGVTSEADRALEAFKKTAEKSLAMNNKFLEEEGYFLDEFTKKKIAAKNSYFEAVKKDGANQAKLAKQLNAQLADIDKERAKDQSDKRQKLYSEAEAIRKKDYDDEAKRIEDLNKLRNALIEADRKRAEEGRKAILQIEKEAIDDEDKKINAINEILKSHRERTEEEKMAWDEKIAIINLEHLNATEEEKQKVRDFYNNKRAENDIKTEQTVADAKASIQDAQLNNVRAGFALLGQLAGKNKALQAASIVAENAVGIAKQVIATRSANALVTAKYALLPGGVALAQAEKMINNIALGIGVASSVAATAKALGALGGGGSASGSSGGSDGGGSAPAAPSFNLVQGTGSNQIAQGLGQGQRPIQAYVVSNNVTTAQSLDRNIIAGASL